MTQILTPSQATFDGTMASLHLDLRLAILHCIRRGGRCWFTVGDSPQVRLQSIRRRGRAIEFVRSGRDVWEALPVGVTLQWAEPNGFNREGAKGAKEYRDAPGCLAPSHRDGLSALAQQPSEGGGR